MIRYCSYQLRCKFEVSNKLKELNLNKKDSNKIIVALEKMNLFSDIEFTKTYIRSKLRLKKWGKLKISHQLHIKNIDKNVITKELEMVDKHEYENIIHDLINKKSKQLNEKDPFIKNGKIASYIIQKGFEHELTWKLIKSLT